MKSELETALDLDKWTDITFTFNLVMLQKRASLAIWQGSLRSILEYSKPRATPPAARGACL